MAAVVPASPGRCHGTGAVTFPRAADLSQCIRQLDLRSTQRITELTPARRIAWRIEDSYLDFVRDKTEWNGTDVIFEVTPTDAGTEVRFTHAGLVPAVECFDNCSNAWQFYVGGSLRNLIAKGQGQPNPKEASGHPGD